MARSSEDPEGTANRTRTVPLRRRWTLRARMAVLTAVTVAAVYAVGTGIAFAVVRHQLYAELDLSLVREANRVSREVERADWVGSGECVYTTAPSCVQIIGAGGAVDPEPGDDSPRVPERAFGVAQGDQDPFFGDARIGDVPIRSYVTPLDGDRAVQVSVRADSVEESVSRVGLQLAVAGSAGIALAALLGYTLTWFSLRPVTRLTRTAETITATRDPSHRIELEGSDELARLASSFDTMLDTLDSSVTAQRQLVADASHELRTPLTGLRTNVDLLGRDLDPERRERVVRALRSQAIALTGLVNDLIELARGDRDAGDHGPVRLDELVEHCVASARRDHPEVRFHVRAAPVVVEGSSERIVRAVTNLLDNAAKFSPRNGCVETVLEGTELTVRDHGPGIAPEDRPHVFDRFYRADSVRGSSGSGLGLAIVRQVADEHGASVGAEAPDGGGTLVRMVFPRGEAPEEEDAGGR